ncbi:LuxR C-terminal-related transcriptional regulator [Catenulispora yoronensis]|uniref:LuxR C-terminal-related transcriptional regulator n=1 Tax=Catenulispora yoronensis TaxID=450799 RepID=A0ABP5GJL4_9ACTN
MLTVDEDDGLTTLSDLLERCRDGNQQIAMVSGAVGMGKTRLVHTFAEHVLGAGGRFCEATASRVERGLQFGVLSQLFLSPALPAWVRERATGQLAVRTVLTGRDEIDPLGGDEAIVSGVAHNLSALILDMFEETGRTLVLAVDDAQHADPASLRCLASVANRLRRAPMFLLVTAANGAQPLDPTFLADLPPARSRRIRLRPLGPGPVQALLAAQVGDAAAVRLAPDCLRLSGGNPAIVRGLIEDLRHQPAEAALRVGAETTAALVGILHRSDPALLRAAQWSALVAEQTSVATTARLAGQDLGTMERMLDLLEQGGVLREGRFREPALRKAVLDGLTPDQRADMHAAAAEALWLEGARASVIADHLLLAGRHDGVWTAAVLNEAAEQALADAEVGSALGYLRLAHSLATDETTRTQTRGLLSRAEWRIDPALAMRHHGYPTSAELGDLTHDGTILTRVSGLLWFGRAEEAGQAMRQAAARGGEDPRYRARLDAHRAWSSLLFPGRAEAVGVEELAARFHLGGAASGVTGGAANVALALTVGMLTDETGESATVAERVLHEFRLEERTLPVLLSAVIALSFGGRLDEAGKWADLLQQNAAEHRAPTWNALFTVARALTALRQGDVTLAEIRAREALELNPAGSWGVSVGLPLSVLLQACTAMGRYNEAFNHLRTPVPDAVFETPFGLLYLQAQGRVHYAREDLSSALRDFETVGRLAGEWRMDYPALVPWRTDAALTLLRMDEPQAAHDLVNEQLKLLTPRHTRERGISLRVLAACSDPAKRPLRLSQAVKELQVSGDRLELAYALADLGVAYHALGEISQARRISQRAFQIARQCGARALTGSLLPQTDAVQAAEEAAERQGSKPGSALSQAERRVAALAADGYTNRQIAGKLFITVSTVEQHLTKVYSKLNVTRRHDLPFGLHREAAGWGAVVPHAQ